MRLWRARNAEHNREYQRAYRATRMTPEQIEAHRASKRAWKAANPERVRAAKERQRLKTSPKGLRVGETHPHWKGEAAKYRTLHQWVERHKGKPRRCEFCGTESAVRFNWMNVDHQYRRDLNDWRRACVPCHRTYDFSNGLSQPGSRWTNAR